ncbi:tRNA wybutosine-synthesizing protein 3 homolog isoform X2 [Hippoglossus hippoglossus]|uniref:tRNA wybutosine-synthesizing protein 3 homolog isoform X2 n=1 Tax=Hippoglossus hippoglossus TaxID=8267 RepID=UPI00148BE276|nr:tRNA wybutosine-synthesizing protein 3 homolog isoform X2 [Hippoglossus hippoglossus]
MDNTFSQWKKQCLNKMDQSKKGSVDQDIEHVVSLLNSREEFFTTSSCSGRTILIDGAPESGGVQKQNCTWLFVSHQKCTSEDLMSGLEKSSGDAVLKFEPFVLHVQCRRLEDAQLMHSVAVNSGFRNSGLTVGKTGKIITAVRSTHGLEVPLSHEGKLLVGHEYVNFLTQTANQKMEENLRRIHRFYQNLQAALITEKLQKLQLPDPSDSQEPQHPPDRLETEKEEKDKTSVYFFGLFTTDIFVNAGQLVTGSLAPYFLSVCQPNYTALSCQDTAHFVSQSDACTGDPNDIMRARKTFPSKEAALSLYTAVYLAMYVMSCIGTSGGRLTGPLLSLSLVSLAVLTGTNRVAEYRNHWSDIIAGQVIGGAIAVFLVVFVVQYFKKRPLIPHSPSDAGTSNTDEASPQTDHTMETSGKDNAAQSPGSCTEVT